MAATKAPQQLSLYCKPCRAVTPQMHVPGSGAKLVAVAQCLECLNLRGYRYRPLAEETGGIDERKINVDSQWRGDA